MNYAYLLAMIGNRLVALISVIILSFLLAPAAFGLYMLAATNALLTEIVFGQWIVISANKHISLAGSAPDRTTASTLGAAMAGYAAVMALVALAYLVFPVAQATPALVAIVLGWSTALVLYDASLASQNGLGESRAYAILALGKNLGASLLSIALVLMGYGAVGAMLGQIVGTLLPVLLLPSSNRLWRTVRFGLASRPLMLKMLKFGVGGTLALGLYMLFNATSRNLAGYFLGESEAGYLSLATDLFFGPLALIGSAYSLSIVPSLYVVAAQGDPDERRARISGFIHMNLYLAIPYAVGGALLGADIALAVLPAASQAEIAAISAAVAVQSAAMLVLYTLTVTMLIFDQRAQLILSVIGTSALNALLLALLLSRGLGLPAAAWASALLLGVAVALFIGIGVARGFIRLELRTLARIGLAAGGMAGAVWLYGRLLPGEPFGATLIGLGVYLLLTAWMGVAYFRELIPKRRQDHMEVASMPGQFE